MKMIESRNAQRNSREGPLELARRGRRRWWCRPAAGSSRAAACAALRGGRPARSPGATLAAQARLRAGGRGGRCARRCRPCSMRRRGCRAAPAAAVALARQRRAAAIGRRRRCGRRSSRRSCDVVVLVDRRVAEAGDLRRRRRPSGAARCRCRAVSTPRSAARSRSMLTRSSGLSSLSVVSASTMPPSSPSTCSRRRLGVLGELSRGRGRGSTKSMSKLPPPMLNDGVVAHRDAQVAELAQPPRGSRCITSRWV